MSAPQPATTEDSEMSAALVIHPDGEIVEVTLRPGGDHIALMQEHLDCRMVDYVALTDRIDMWIDDDGMHTKPVNPAATALARRYGLVWQNYHGPALLCGADDRGESINLTRDQLVGLLTTSWTPPKTSDTHLTSTPAGGHVKIRLHGTLDECRQAAERVRENFRVVAVSDPYPDRPPSQLYRVHLEVRLP